MDFKERIKMFEMKGSKAPIPHQEARGNKTAGANAVNVKLADKYKLSLFDRPLPLIVKHDTGEGNALSYNHDTLEELSQIEEPLCVIAVAGCLRTGKSFLLSRLVQKCGLLGESFTVGHSIKAQTKGIWIMCRPHPTQEGKVIVFLDTEGIDDPEKVEIQEDTWIFLIATLLCNVLVYNTKGVFDASHISKFRFLKVVHNNVTVAKGACEDDSFLDFFFPNFVLVLRDFRLTSDTSSEEFLENRLVYKTGKSDSVHEYNEPRRLLRRYFKKRTCFEIPIPCTRPEQLESMPDSKIESDFLQRVNDLHQYLCECSPKKLISGKPLNGRMLRTMIISYMNSVQENTAPCLNDTIKLMAEEENQFAIRKASECYQEEMKKRINKHMPNEKGLKRYHNDCMDVAVKKLKELVVLDDGDIFHRRATECFENHLQRFKSIIDRDSLAKCKSSLDKLDMKIQRKIRENKYAHSHGYSEYIEDINTLVDEFTKQERYLGSKTRAALQGYMDAKVEEDQLVYEMVKDKIDAEAEHQLHRLSSGSVPIPKKFANVTEGEQPAEQKARESIEKLEFDGLMSIGSKCLENLELKLQEIEQAKAELSEDNTYYKQLVAEYDVWNNIYKQAQFAKYQNTPKSIQKPKDVEKRTERSSDDKELRLKKKTSENPKCPIL
ncbi:guanylate-binding protein 1-like [Mya arenaria]|uniref:guanylate-binding protein 1-like n=1 Tax=Mya arenaria TaxID=6604 RepID=UPI0022E862A1|nr:guanylate-binding protein 1-like [Mya arenaria]XP_052777296.1 guanylate-binding protein 1-like [Mya arenaria]